MFQSDKYAACMMETQLRRTLHVDSEDGKAALTELFHQAPPEYGTGAHPYQKMHASKATAIAMPEKTT